MNTLTHTHIRNTLSLLPTLLWLCGRFVRTAGDLFLRVARRLRLTRTTTSTTTTTTSRPPPAAPAITPMDAEEEEEEEEAGGSVVVVD